MYVQQPVEEGTITKADWYYGVANRKDNYSGVFQDYPAAQAMVEQVSGVSWKKFRMMEEASQVVQTHQRDLHARSPGHRSKRHSHFEEPGKERCDSLTGVSLQRVQAPFQVTLDLKSKGGYIEGNHMGYGKRGQLFKVYGSPLEFVGEDPSTNK